jgi:dTDP-4-amino-4,6-dideoxygalactose transaminase
MRLRRVRFVDLNRLHRSIRGELESAVERVIDSGRFVGGEEVSGFEDRFSQYVGSKHGVGVGSGGDALRFSLLSLGVGPGDRVATVSHSFVATADAIVHCGARPLFIDIDPQTATIDVEALRRHMSRNVKAIIPVHIYGQTADMAPLMELAETSGIPVIEDAAQSHGAEYHGKKAGSIGMASCFSFYPSKNLGALGDGGMVCTDDTKLAERVRLFRDYGQREKYQHALHGFNSRLDPLQAALLSAKLSHLDGWNEERRRAASAYDSELEKVGRVIRPVEAAGRRHVYHIYSIRVKRRDSLRQFLGEKGIETGVHYPLPIHRLQSYQGAALSGLNLPQTDEVSKTNLSLPMFPGIKDAEVRYVSDAISSWSARH